MESTATVLERAGNVLEVIQVVFELLFEVFSFIAMMALLLFTARL